MSEEIKINKLNKSIMFINNGISYSQFGIADEILDLITNLQQENEKLKYNARGQVNDYFKDKYADEVLKNAELKEENEKLQTTVNNCKQENEILRKNAEHNDKVVDKARWNEMIHKSRNEKAIEYIKSTNCYGMRSGKTLLQKYLCDLLNILNGSDEE